jgi:hypothetical protein
MVETERGKGLSLGKRASEREAKPIQGAEAEKAFTTISLFSLLRAPFDHDEHDPRSFSSLFLTNTSVYQTR